MPNPACNIAGEHFVEANAVALDAIGYRDRPAFLRLHPADISPKFQPGGASSRAKASRIFKIVRREGVHRFEWIHKHRDGSLFPVEVTPTMTDWQ